MKVRHKQFLIISLFAILFFLVSPLTTKIYAKEPCNNTSERPITCPVSDDSCNLKAYSDAGCYYLTGDKITYTDVCYCESGIYECTYTKEQNGDYYVWTRTWNCGKSSDLKVNLSVDQGCVIVPVSDLTATTTIRWSATPSDNVDYCTGLNQSGRLSASGEAQVSVRPTIDGKLNLNSFTITCYDKQGGQSSASIAIKASTASCEDPNASALLTTTPNIPVALTSEGNSCYGDTSTSIWHLLFQGIDYLISVIFWILAWIFKWVLTAIVIPVFLWILNPNSWGGMAGNNPMVSGLWSTVKDIANIGLLLAVVAIAIATIFRIKGYELKSTILKLVVVALLVNFSLTICGIFIDLSNYVTLYFLNSGQTGNLAGNIGATLDAIACATQKFATNTMPQTMSAIVILIISIILIGQFIGLVAYAAVRIVTLWLTTILSPLTMIAAILPATKNVWKMWLNYFTTYLISIPAIAFSLWFVITATTGAARNIITSNQNSTLIAGVAYAIVWIILFQIPLLVAKTLNADMMGKGYKWASGLIGGALVGGAAWLGRKVGTRAMLSRTAAGAAEKLKTVSPTLGPALEQKIKQIRESAAKQTQQRIEGIEDPITLTKMLTSSLYTPEAKLSILTELAKIQNGAHLAKPEVYQQYQKLKARFGDTDQIKAVEKLVPSWKSIPENYPQLSPAEKEKIISILLDKTKKETVKEANWLAMFKDLEMRNLLEEVGPDFISNISYESFIRMVSAIPRTADRAEFIRKYIVEPHIKTGKALNPEIAKHLKNQTLAGSLLTPGQATEISNLI